MSTRNAPGDTWSQVTSLPLYKNVHNLVEAIVRQDKPYILPRPAGSFVCPHQITINKEIKVSNADIVAGNGRRAIIVTNDPNNILIVGSATAYNFSQYAASEWIEQDITAGDVLYQTGPLQTTSGEYVFPVPSIVAQCPAGYFFVKESEHNWIRVDGRCVYPFRVVSAGNLKQLAVTQGNTDQINFTYGCLGIAGNVLYTKTVLTTAVSKVASYDWAADGAFSTFLSASLNAIATYFYCSPVADIQIQETQVNTDAVCTTKLGYTGYSLWELTGQDSSVLYAQYAKSQLFNPTGLRALFQNLTPGAAEGGAVYGARLPSHSFKNLPGTMDGLIGFVSSQKHHVLRENKLAKGANYVYTPEKVQDYFFQQPLLLEDEIDVRQPFGVSVLDPPNLLSSDFILNINLTYSYELITTDISATLWPSASSEVLMNQLLYALSKENGWSENPNHLKHAADMVKRIMSSDEMKYALTSLFNAGVKIAPMVLSSIL